MSYWTSFFIILTVFILVITLGFMVVVLSKNPTFVHNRQNSFDSFFIRLIAFGLVVGAIVITCFFFAILGKSSQQKPETTKPVQAQNEDDEENYTPVENFQ